MEVNMQIKYELIIYWSEVDQAFIVEVPELPGCAADGETYQEAVQNVEVVIREWIETAQVLGRSIPEPKGRLMFA
jgi:predicted RNase H-like HicB family nuclease